MMTKAFWEGFRTGYITTSKFGIPMALAFVLGMAVGSYSHPYEVCKRMYDTQEDTQECIWLLEQK
jgi:hypothetical protein